MNPLAELFRGPYTAQKISSILGLLLAVMTIYQFLIARRSV